MVDIVGPMTFGDAWDAAVRRAPDRPFLVFLDAAGGRAEFTYRAFDDQVARAAGVFAARGIGLGTVVALRVRNSPEFLACLLGLAKIGAITVPLGRGSTPSELGGLYRTCKATWALVEADECAVHADVREREALLPGGIIPVHGDVDGIGMSFERLCATCEPLSVPRPDIDGDGVAELLFTSGTTAQPKCVMVTHANLVFSGHYAIWQAGLRSDDRMFTTMPACHSNFQLVALTGVVVAGACLVMGERYSAHRFWSDVRRERATVIQLIAMMVRTLLLQPPDADDAAHCVRETLYFMPISDAEKQAFEERFAVRFMNSYGLTESIGWAVTDPPQGERRWPSVGRAGLGYEVAIADAQGHEVAPGQVGEFWIRGVPGRTLMAGYLDDPEATAAALRPDGWMRTHDTGYCDDQGWFYFVDRSHNVIKRSGENISATEIETVLTAHPLIADAAVIGVPDPVRDQQVKAFVQLTQGAGLDEAGVQAYCREHLAAYKVPGVVEIVDGFPRTASMKIEKRLLH